LTQLNPIHLGTLSRRLLQSFKVPEVNSAVDPDDFNILVIVASHLLEFVDQLGHFEHLEARVRMHVERPSLLAGRHGWFAFIDSD
jgi:hypothetical protein